METQAGAKGRSGREVRKLRCDERRRGYLDLLPRFDRLLDRRHELIEPERLVEHELQPFAAAL